MNTPNWLLRPIVFECVDFILGGRSLEYVPDFFLK